jgi:putative hydrolase of the HAD superfamily
VLRGVFTYGTGVEPPLRGILFDLDETLYSREAAFWKWIESEAVTAAAQQLDRAKVSELDQRGRGDKRVLLEYLDAVFDWGETPDERHARYRRGLATTVQLAPAVRDSLTRLARRFRLGLVSNGSGATQRAKLRALGLESLFDPIVISEEVGVRKPDARIFGLAVAAWRVPPASVLFVGDDPVSDIDGAKAAGLRALRVGHAEGIPSILALEAWLEAGNE